MAKKVLKTKQVKFNSNTEDASRRAREVITEYHRMKAETKEERDARRRTRQAGEKPVVKKSTNMQFYEREATKAIHKAFADLRLRFEVGTMEEILGLTYILDEYLRRGAQVMVVQGLAPTSNVTRHILIQATIATLLGSAGDDAKRAGLPWPLAMDDAMIQRINQFIEKELTNDGN